MQRVITYQTPSGDSIDLTPAEIAEHERAGTWPRNSVGEEFCTVSHGLHFGIPTSELLAEHEEGDE